MPVLRLLVVALLATFAHATAHGGESGAADQAAPRRVRAWLDAVYREIASGTSDWQSDASNRLAAFASSDAAARTAIADWVLATLKQSGEDQAGGSAPLRRGWSLGGPQGIPDEVRSVLARRLEARAGSTPPAEMLEAALWLAEEDPLISNRRIGARIALRIETDAANAAVSRWLQAPHGVYSVLEGCLEVAAQRPLAGVDDSIRSLCHHFHPRVAAAARAAATARGLDVGDHVASDDGVHPRIAHYLQDLAADVPDAIPENAMWTRVDFARPRTFDFDDFAGVDHREGWLIADTDEHLELLDLFGQRIHVDRSTAHVGEASLPALAASLVHAREHALASEEENGLASFLDWNSPMSRFQRQVGVFAAGSSRIVGETPTWGGSLPEVLLAAWCLRRGETAAARELVGPLLLAHDDERELFDLARMEFLARVDRAMLDAFRSRAYDRALDLAHHLAQPRFATWWVHERALSLAAELPARRDDFVTLRLPTTRAWELLRASLERREQVEFLARRLRLITVAQYGIPGGLDWEDPQFEESPAPALRGTDRLTAYPRTVVNPYATLLGMDLSGIDALQLIPLLTSEQHILGYDLPRFMPHWPWRLHRVRWLVASLVSAALGDGVIDREALASGDAAVRRAHLLELEARARAQGLGTEADRHAHVLACTQEDDAFQTALLRLGRLQPARAARVLLSRARHDRRRRGLLVRLAYAQDQPETLHLFAPFACSTDPTAAFWTAAMRLRHGKGHLRGVSLDRVLADLERADPHGRIDVVADDLLDTGDVRVAGLLRRYLVPGADPNHEPTRLVLQRAFLRGEPAAYRLLLATLASKHGLKTRPFDGDEPPAAADEEDSWWRPRELDHDDVVRWIRSRLLPRRAEAVQDEVEEETPEEATTRARTIVEQAWRAIQAGSPPDVRLEERGNPLGRWEWVSSGWVLRTR